MLRQESTGSAQTGMSYVVRLAHSGFVRAIAVAILLLAGTEIVFCAECSPDSCSLSHWPSHEKPTSSGSGDECLCCCAHLVIAQPVHIEPVAIVAPLPFVTSPSLAFVPSLPVFHPPQI